MFWKRKKTVITEQKSIKRLEQEKIINDWKIKLKKISIPTLENALSDLEKKMNQYSLIEFDEDIQNIESIIDALPDKERLLFNYDMGYKFSKSSEEFTQYFSEAHFTNYPEMCYVETKNGVGLSFTANKNCLLYCAVYGDQLTQIPLNVEHPYYDKLKDANIGYRGGVFDEYHSNILLTGKNISLSNPYVLKDIIKLSSNQAILSFLHPLHFTKNECKNLGEIYRKIGFFETAEFYRDIVNVKNKGKDIKQVIDEILPDKNENILDTYYLSYIDMCKKYK